MLPLSDGLSARRFPVVNIALIVANFAVWLFYELPHLNSAIYHASFYPCAVASACHAPEPWGVALSGTVPSYPQYRQAAEAARRVAGVSSVHNHLEVVLPPGDYRDDAMLTTAASNALAASTAVPEGVEATARHGNLTLTGAVKYPSQRAAAESAVAGLTGVRNISNEIGFVFDVAPGDVNALVKDALEEHAGQLDDSRVVTGISGNTVTLIGHVRTQAQRDAVVRAAWRGHAVMAVVDQIEITG